MKIFQLLVFRAIQCSLYFLINDKAGLFLLFVYSTMEVPYSPNPSSGKDVHSIQGHDAGCTQCLQAQGIVSAKDNEPRKRCPFPLSIAVVEVALAIAASTPKVLEGIETTT